MPADAEITRLTGTSSVIWRSITNRCDACHIALEAVQNSRKGLNNGGCWSKKLRRFQSYGTRRSSGRWNFGSHSRGVPAQVAWERTIEVVVVSPLPHYNWIPSNIWVGVGLMKAEKVVFPLAPVYAKSRNCIQAGSRRGACIRRARRVTHPPLRRNRVDAGRQTGRARTGPLRLSGECHGPETQFWSNRRAGAGQEQPFGLHADHARETASRPATD